MYVHMTAIFHKSENTSILCIENSYDIKLSGTLSVVETVLARVVETMPARVVETMPARVVETMPARVVETMTARLLFFISIFFVTMTLDKICSGAWPEEGVSCYIATMKYTLVEWFDTVQR